MKNKRKRKKGTKDDLLNSSLVRKIPLNKKRHHIEMRCSGTRISFRALLYRTTERTFALISVYFGHKTTSSFSWPFRQQILRVRGKHKRYPRNTALTTSSDKITYASPSKRNRRIIITAIQQRKHPVTEGLLFFCPNLLPNRRKQCPGIIPQQYYHLIQLVC